MSALYLCYFAICYFSAAQYLLRRNLYSAATVETLRTGIPPSGSPGRSLLRMIGGRTRSHYCYYGKFNYKKSFSNDLTINPYKIKIR